tara:strand:+ start:192 stop:431 length:240 start_codon:yes stop_codon:yes gene_type:complete
LKAPATRPTLIPPRQKGRMTSKRKLKKSSVRVITEKMMAKMSNTNIGIRYPENAKPNKIKAPMPKLISVISLSIAARLP